MQKLKKYFEHIGFAGEELERILNAFVCIDFKKNDHRRLYIADRPGRPVRHRDARIPGLGAGRLHRQYAMAALAGRRRG